MTEFITKIKLHVSVSDLNEVEKLLLESNPFITSFSHDLKRVYSIITYHQQKLLCGTTAFLFPDRQIISYITSLFKGSKVPERERRLVGAIMAFAIMGDIKIEPYSAIYEYADAEGEDAAWSDLCVFRHADNAGAKLFTDLALGRIQSIPEIALYPKDAATPIKPNEFSQPSIRWFDFCYPIMSPSESKPATCERFKTSHPEAGIS